MRKTKMALATLFIGSTLSAEPLGQAAPLEPECAMALPSVKLLKNFKGPVDGPFILPENDGHTVSLLSMNIQNLPMIEALKATGTVNPDYRDDRLDCLTKLAGQFDAAALQEDFMDRKAEQQTSWKPRYKAEGWFKFGRPGLSFQSRLPFERLEAKPYTPSLCYGWLGAANDCLTTKAYQTVHIGGVTVINTHLDAGSSSQDEKARAAQVDELVNAIPETGPVMLVADMNFYKNSSVDEQSLARLLRERNLTLYMRYSLKKGHDFVAARDVAIESIGAIEDRLLSDHAGLAINFKPFPSPPLPTLQLARK